MALPLAARNVAATVTTAGGLTAGSHNSVDATSGSLTMTLPTPTHLGAYLSVEKIDSTANTVVISGSIRGGEVGNGDVADQQALHADAFQVQRLVGGRHDHAGSLQMIADQALHQRHGMHVQTG